MDNIKIRVCSGVLVLIIFLVPLKHSKIHLSIYQFSYSHVVQGHWNLSQLP